MSQSVSQRQNGLTLNTTSLNGNATRISPTIPSVKPLNSSATIPVARLSPSRLSSTIPVPKLSPSRLTIEEVNTTNNIQDELAAVSAPRLAPVSSVVIPTARLSPGRNSVPILAPVSSVVIPTARLSPGRNVAPVQVSTIPPMITIPVPKSPYSPLVSRASDSPNAVAVDLIVPSANVKRAQSIKLNTPSIRLPVKPTAEIMNQEFEVKDFQGIIANSSLENELLGLGYITVSKIVIKADDGTKRTQYIKAINKKGQKVFILVDVQGYTTALQTDLTLIETNNVNGNIVPYSLKTGAYNCAGTDVSGIAFECGSDAVCVLVRGVKEITPKESTFVFIEQPGMQVMGQKGSIMTYPIVRLSEIRANADLILCNTDIVTRRLRNKAYVAELEELAVAQQSIGKLNAAYVRFNCMREDNACKLNRTLTQLEQWNDIYMANPPCSDEAKDRYRRLQYNLMQRNEGITTLLRCMKKVADKYQEIDCITREIDEITEYCEKEFINVEYAIAE